ncbi:MAG TPA: serine/threonine-protein kinase [Ktedonobacteraceae bacterium]|nr:serine/threonine-protein kinase [Ktedonobacteraceae bacterium]
MSLEGNRLGQYQLQRLLGSGGMGEVYLAEDARIGQQVAIKVTRTEAAFYPDSQSLKDAFRLFQREARAIAQLDHAHILPLFGYGEEIINGSPVTYIVMPYRHEGTFANWLQQQSGKGLLPKEDIVYFIGQAANALQYAHNRSIVHQDVKPSNFLIRTNQDNPRLPDLLLADFGIAKLNSATASMSGSVRGTPAYMAPEQWLGEPVPASDQYALAVLAYELLTGRLPFTGRQANIMYQHLNVVPEPPSTINPTLSKDTDAVILKALAKNPQNRFLSIAVFAAALREAIEGSDKDASTIIKGSNPSHDNDLHIMLAISKDEAQSGTRRTLNLSNGQHITISVPAGSYDGQTLWLRRPGLQTGSLIITLSVQDTGTPPLSSSGSGDSFVYTVPVTPVAPLASAAERRPIHNPITPPTNNYFNRGITDPNLTGSTSSTPTPAPTGRPTLPKAVLILLVVLAFLLVVTSFGFFFLLGANRATPTTSNSNTPDVAATTHANDATAFAATTTAQVTATHTNAVTPTPTPPATINNATPTTNPTTTTNITFPPAGGTLALNDPLVDNSQGWQWETKPDANGVCQFTNGAYQVNENLTNTIEYCPAYNTSFTSNFAYQVRMTIVQGDSGGLLIQSGSNGSYYFILSQNGQYSLAFYTSKKPTYLTTGTAPSFSTGLGQSNLIQVSVTSNNIALFVNNQFLQNVSIGTYGLGYIGVFVKDFQNPTEAVFRNAEVWNF